MLKTIYFVCVGLAASVFAFGFSFVVGVLMFGHRTFGISYYGVLDYYPMAAVLSGVGVGLVMSWFKSGSGGSEGDDRKLDGDSLAGWFANGGNRGLARFSAYLTVAFTLCLYLIIQLYLGNIHLYPVREEAYFLVGRGIRFVPFIVLTGLCFFTGLFLTGLAVKYFKSGWSNE